MPRKRSMMSAGLAALQADAIGGLVQRTTAAGSTAADARLITASNVLFQTASAGGAALPPADPGDRFHIKNESGNTVTLYPSATAGTVTINTTTSLSIATAKSVIVFFTTATECHSIPTVAS